MSGKLPQAEAPANEKKEEEILDLKGGELARYWLAAIIESAEDAIVSKTLDGIITSWNKGAEHVFGYTAEEAIGQPILMLIPPGHDDEEPSIIARLRRGERIEHYETQRVRKDGQIIDISLTVSPIRNAEGKIIGASKIARDITARVMAERRLREATEETETLYRLGQVLAGELDLHKLVQSVTDVATEVTGAHFGSFFYNVLDERGASYMLYTLSGVPREAFTHFPMPRATDLFGPTFRGEGVVRIDDVRQDPRYGKNSPYYGMPEGHLPVVSYLAVPVISRSGEVLGGLFFGDPEPGVFTERHARIISGLAAQTAVAVDNARLFDSAQRERERAESAHNQVNRLLESITDAFFALDHEWRFTYLNQQAESLLQRSVTELLGKVMWDEFPETKGTAFEEQYRRAVAEHSPITFEELYTPTERWFEARAYPSGDGLSVYFHDVTERRRADEALLERTRLAELNADIGLALTSVDDMQEMLGRCAEAMVKHLDAAFARIWTLDQQGETLELQASAGLYTNLDGSHARIAVGEYKIGRIARDRRPHMTNQVIGDEEVSDQEWARREGMISFAGYPLVIEDRLLGVLAMFARKPLTVVTLDALSSVANAVALGIERKRSQEERAHLLERERQARMEAEQANRAKDEFLAVLSHELRTPLTSILGWSRLLLGDQLKETDRERALNTIQRNAHLQSQLIDDILDVSRIITGKLRLEVRPVELSFVIEAAIESVLPAADAKQIRLQRVLDSGTSFVSGDPNRLQQVVWNLLTNAIKFTPRHGRVQVRLERVDSHVEIIVTDTGPGIKPEALPFIFDRFRQADSTTTRRHGGLGLGLAIVRHLVEMHGGTVEVESNGNGTGATFTVKLPLIATRSASVMTEQRRESAHPTASSGVSFDCPPALEGLHVLVVDDEEDTRFLVSSILEQCAARVSTASSAEEGLEMLKRLRPDVVLSDLGMPVEDGYSLITKVRALPPEEGGRTPAAALTAYARVEDRMKVLRAGFQIHLPKPVEPAELVTVVASLAGWPAAE
ncbi:MAG TPA: PAS domain S-box protein [Pyrinomonadaceae bacterium]|jgi:PAS domain S-box-containing protein